MPRVRIGALPDLADRRGTAVEVAGRRLAIFREGDQVYAIDDRCSHRGFPLNDGSVAGGVVGCRTHGACFDLATGAVVRGPARRPIRTYPVTIEDNQLFIDL
jgi:3-phenylpropionate/trans-cinnamate dioxygenase ferredoxin component